MSLWFLAHRDELLLDLDAYDKPTRSGLTWGEVFFRRRLRTAIEAGKLAVRRVYLAPSSHRPGHRHGAIVLREPMPLLERLAWQAHLGSDLYRSRADWMRAARGMEGEARRLDDAYEESADPRTLYDWDDLEAAGHAVAPTLLIRSSPLHRAADYVCPCTAKHVTSKSPTCDVWRQLRGATPWQMFGPTSPEGVEAAVKLPDGDVPISRILEHRR